MNIHLPYGTTTVFVDIPDNWINGRCYRSFRFDPAPNDLEALREAIQNPLGIDSVKEAVSGKGDAVVVIDAAFPSLFGEFIPHFLAHFEELSGLQSDQIRVIIANTTWMPHGPETIDYMVPSDIRTRYVVELHDPFNDSATREIGSILGSIDLKLNASYLDADLKILLGPVYPDLIHGFCGGRSLLLPGLAHESTVAQLYSYENVSKPTASYGVIRDNPFHVAGLQATQKAGVDLVVAPIMSAQGRISQLLIGDPWLAFLTAVERITEKMTVNLKEPMDIVVTCGGGRPYDSSFYQVLNAISAAEPVLKKDGTIIVTAEMCGGFGPDPLRQLLLEMESPSEFDKRFASNGATIPGQWVLQRYFRTLAEHEILTHTGGIPTEEVWAAGMTPIGDLAQGVEIAMQDHGQRCKICALPDGPFSLAAVAGS